MLKRGRGREGERERGDWERGREGERERERGGREICASDTILNTF